MRKRQPGDLPIDDRRLTAGRQLRARLATLASGRALALSCLLLFLAARESLAVGCGRFPPDPVTVRFSPNSVALGDLDGDGILDLAVTNGGSTSVSIVLGNGDGTFGADTAYPLASTPRHIAIGDLDGDGDADLAIAMSHFAANDLAILLGNGDGTFAAPENNAAGIQSHHVAVGDLDGDGDADLAVANNSDLSILLGNGDGTFSAAVSYGAGTGPSSVAIGDLDADGDADLAVAGGGNNVWVLLGNGDGTFAAAVAYGGGFSPRSVRIGDLDGDGDADLAVANPTIPAVSVLLGNGDGSFAAPVSYVPTRPFTNPASVEIGDLDGDGDADLATVSLNDFAILLGNGDGTFAAAVSYQDRPATNSSSLALGDLDGDGVPDLAVTNDAANDVSIVLGNGDGTFTVEMRFAATYPQSLALGDLDGDGNADLAVTNSSPGSNTVSTLLGNGDGTFAPTVSHGVGTRPLSVAIGDLDGDGDADLATANVDSSDVSILLGNGDGTFAAAVSYGAGPIPRSVAIGDLDGDGDADLAVAGSGVWVLAGNGDGTFAAAVSYGAGIGSSSVAIGDLDGDGDADLAVANGGASFPTVIPGDVSILLGNGDGTFAAAVSQAAGPRHFFVAIGDLDGDGNEDVAVENFNADDVSILLSNGDGTFAAEVSYGVGQQPRSIAIADLDGDGVRDLAVVTSVSNAVSILLGNGNGTFPAAVSYGVGASPSTNPFFVAIGDLDGDGDRDLAVANVGTDNVSILLNLCPSSPDPIPGVTVTPTSGLITTEAGGTATFTVVLDSAPSGDVVIEVASSDTSEGTVAPPQLTFTGGPSGNWATAQTLTLTGVDDAGADGDQAYTVLVTTNTAATADPDYDAIDPVDVGATNLDDDTAGVTVTPTSGLVTTEVAGTATFTVVLDTEPSGGVVIDLASSDPSEGTVAPAQVVFTGGPSGNWATAQTVTATGVNDAVDDGDQAYTIIVTTNTAATADPAYDALDPADVGATNLDDDTAGAPQVTTVTSEMGGPIAPCGQLATPAAPLAVSFDEAMADPEGDTEVQDVTNPANYQLISAGPDHDLGTVACDAPVDDDEIVPAASVTYDAGAHRATVSYLPGAVTDGPYLLLVCGALQDEAGTPLAGGDFALTFRQDVGNLFSNGHFDCDLDPWFVVTDDSATIDHSGEDVDGAATSGSAHVQQLAASTDAAIAQCVPVTPGTRYRLSATVLTDAGGGDLVLERFCIPATLPTCDDGGSPLPPASDPLVPGAGWLPFTAELIIPAGVTAALCGVNVHTPSGAVFDLLLDDMRLERVSLFADGFEDGSTAAWSAVLP